MSLAKEVSSSKEPSESKVVGDSNEFSASELLAGYTTPCPDLMERFQQEYADEYKILTKLPGKKWVIAGDFVDHLMGIKRSSTIAVKYFDDEFLEYFENNPMDWRQTMPATQFRHTWGNRIKVYFGACHDPQKTRAECMCEYLKKGDLTMTRVIDFKSGTLIDWTGLYMMKLPKDSIEASKPYSQYIKPCPELMEHLRLEYSAEYKILEKLPGTHWVIVGDFVHHLLGNEAFSSLYIFYFDLEMSNFYKKCYGKRIPSDWRGHYQGVDDLDDTNEEGFCTVANLFKHKTNHDVYIRVVREAYYPSPKSLHERVVEYLKGRWDSRMKTAIDFCSGVVIDCSDKYNLQK